MGSQVNKRFVLILSIVLVVIVAGLAVPAYFVLTKSAAEHIRDGDKAMSEGDYKEAEKAYGKAVSEDRTNVEYLEKWRSALEAYTPEDRVDFTKSFQKLYSAMYEIAYNKRTDLDAWIEYFEFARIAAPGQIDERVRVATQIMKTVDPEGAEYLRRYRGLTKAARVLSGSFQADDEELQGIMEDLEAALAARDDDEESARTLFNLHRFAAGRVADRRPEEAAEHARAAQRVVEEFLAKHPENATMQMTRLELLANGPMQALLGTPLEPGARPITTEMVDRVVALLDAMPAEDITLDHIGQLQRLETMAEGVSRLTRTRELTKRLVEQRPDDVLMRWARAFVLRLSGDPDEAYDALQYVVDLPMQRVSIDGYRLFNVQVEALAMQSDLAFRAWESADSDEERQAAIERLRSRNAELETRLPADSPVLLLSRARVAFATGDDAEARRLLAQYTQEAGDTNPDALWMQARLAVKAGNTTEAADRLDRLLEVRPGELRAIQMRAGVYAELREYDKAIELLEGIAQAIPEAESLREQIRRLRVLAGQAPSDDPVQDVLIRAARVAQGTEIEPGDMDAAVQMLRDAIDRIGPDARLFGQLTTFLLNTGAFDEAREAVAQGLAANPDNENLQRLRSALNSGQTPTEIAFGIIDSSPDMAPIDKLLAKYRVAVRNGEDDLSRQILEQAVALDPDNKTVLELQILRAIADRDEDAAEPLVARAEQADLDGVGGRTYRAQLLSMQGRLSDALAVLQEARELRPERVDILRRIGQIQFALGETNAALETYREAMRLRGDDTGLIAEYVRQLRRAGQSAEALRVLMDVEELARGNATLRELRLDLEAEVGNRAEAMRIRKEILAREPENRANRIKLVRLLMDDARWDEARPLLDALRDEGDTLELARLDARWHAEQGDLEQARREFTEYIGALFNQFGDLPGPEPYLELGRFLIEHGQRDAGIEAIRQAKRWEDEDTLIVEKILADTLASIGRFDEAIDSYTAIVESGKDTPQKDYAKRLGEMLMRAGYHDEAEQLLASLEAEGFADETVRLLRTENAILADDLDRAQTLVQQLVQQYPNSARAYFQRARLAAKRFEKTGNPALLADAREDLGTAISNDPSFAEAYRLRSQILARLGEDDEALDDLRRAVEARPPTMQLLQDVIERFVEAGRAADAATMASTIVENNPGDLRLLLNIGNAFANADDWQRARTYYELAWERSHDAQTALRYVSSLMRSGTSDYQRAIDALNSIEQVVVNNPGLLLARAEALHGLGRDDLAIEDAVRAFALVIQLNAGPSGWYGEVRRIFGNTPLLYRTLQEAKRGGQRRELLDLFAARALSEEDDTFLQSMQLFDQLIAQPNDMGVRKSAYVFKGTALLRHDRPEDAVLTWQEGLAQFDDEWQLHNNLAYVLAEDLDRAADALPHARRAVELASDNPSVLDTLGWVLYRLGQLEEAEQVLERALLLTGSIEANPTIALHVAITRAARGDKDRSGAIVQVIDAITKNGANLRDQDRELLEEAKAKIASLG